MLRDVLGEMNNFFSISHESAELEIVADGIVGTFSNDYIVGQYIEIENSILNDDVYQITAVTTSKLTLQGTLLAEPSKSIDIFGLAIPKRVLQLSTDIQTHVNGTTSGITSESQGNVSVSYSGDSSWQNVFRLRLDEYRRLENDKERFFEVKYYDSPRYCQYTRPYRRY